MEFYDQAAQLLEGVKDSLEGDYVDCLKLLRDVYKAMGQDDKMSETQELLARITVQLRNANKTSAASEQRVLTFGTLTLNMDTHILYIENPDVSDKSECKITRTEFAILKLLMQNPEQVVAKLTILDNISIDTPDCTEDSLKIHIHNLRKKLKEATGKELIKAVWGIGFMITSKS